jgi:hypothetical protein
LRIRPFRWGIRIDRLDYRRWVRIRDFPWHRLGLLAEPYVDGSKPSTEAYSIRLRRRRHYK